MIKVIGVRFRTAGKIYFFDPLGFEIKKGDHVIVETARGIEFGTVVAGVMEVTDDKVVQPLKAVIRIANQRDVEQEAANRSKEKEAFKICQEKIRDHGLEMKLIDAEYTFDNNKVLFYFTADGRIDFRELVKDLASVFKTRIELRQIGVRDETKLVGGIGICGRPLCCHSYLADFVPVSIKMAKEQNLSLNPAKISGVCGRLMCCLKNEEETYEELNRRLPGIGDSVTTEEGLKGEVHSVNVLRQLVKVVVDVGDEKEIKEYPVEKLHFRRKHSKKERMELSKEELQELERLEEEEFQKEEQKLVSRAEEEQRQSTRNRQDKNRQTGNRRQNGQHSNEGQKQTSQRAEGNRRQNGQGGQRQAGQRTGAGSRQSNRPEDGQRQPRRNAEEETRQPGRHAEEEQRQSGRRFEGEQRQSGRRPEEEEQRQSGKRPEGRQQHGEEQSGGQHGSSRRRYDNRRQDKNHQGGQQQENHDHQGGKNRYDNRNRHDTRTSQEGQQTASGNQAGGNQP